jgi:ATP-dependent DNA ligase
MERLYITPEHQLILLIEKEPRASKKLEMLRHYRRSPLLRAIFDYANNPFRKFYIKKFPKGVIGSGTEKLGPDTWALLDKLTDRDLTGAKAKDCLFAYIRSLHPSEGLLLKRIVRKKLTVGVSTATINKVWPGLIPVRAVQKAEDWDPSRAVFPMFASAKLDGIRAEYKGGLFTARSGFPISGLDHLVEELKKVSDIGQWDGELHVPGLEFDTASGIIRGSGDKSSVLFTIFDVPGLKGLPFFTRYSILKDKFKSYADKTHRNKVTYLHHGLVHTLEEADAFYNKCLALGYEGTVYKMMSGFYEAGRNYNWMKRKKRYEGEHLVLGVYEGEDGFTGTLGGIIIETMYGRRTKVGSGFNQTRRKMYWEDPSLIVGKYVTITAMEKTKSGSLRHPVFKSERWDI